MRQHAFRQPVTLTLTNHASCHVANAPESATAAVAVGNGMRSNGGAAPSSTHLGSDSAMQPSTSLVSAASGGLEGCGSLSSAAGGEDGSSMSPAVAVIQNTVNQNASVAAHGEAEWPASSNPGRALQFDDM